MKKLLVLCIMFLSVLVLGACEPDNVQHGLSDEEVNQLIDTALIQERAVFEGKYQELQEEIDALQEELEDIQTRECVYNYDYTEYYLSDYTDEQLQAAILQVFENHGFDNSDWEELILDVIDDYDLIAQIEQQLIDIYYQALTQALEEIQNEGN